MTTIPPGHVSDAVALVDGIDGHAIFPSNARCSSVRTTQTTEDKGEEEEGEDEDSITDEELESLVQKIEEIERSWDNWQPEDELMLVIKTSIDRASLEYLL